MPDGVQIEAQGHLFKVRAAGSPQIGGGRRGAVVGFSSASRKRLLEKLARLRLEGASCLFVTLTYPQLVDCGAARADLISWCKRLRRAFPAAGVVWRLELQARGVPHFHLLIFGVPFLPVAWIRATWRACIGYEGPHTLQVNVKRVQGWRGVIGYVAKYVAKVQEGFQMAQEAAEAAALLDDVTYLSALVGRCWGIRWADSLPWADLRCFSAAWGSWVWRLKRCARRAWLGVGQSAAGFALFREDAGAWLRLASYFEGSG